jgi:crotonobetainyl-CoA:carnitine CoA-transferase CaiB-like acyl-CoA transferase
MDVLEGIRVLDLGDSAAASIVGMILSDFGAEVVKVRALDIDDKRDDAGAAVWDRGKKSVTLDRESTDDLAWLTQMVAGADVCLTTMDELSDRWGAPVASSAAANQRLVHLALPPYLASGTPWAGGAESEALLAAHAGVAWRQSSEDGAPVDSVYRLLTHVHGAWSTTCLIAALIERERSGWGQHVTVTGINAVMEACVSSLTVDPNAPDPTTAVGGFGRHPTYRPVRAADGWLACGALGGKFETKVFELAGLRDLLDDRLGGRSGNMLMPENISWVMDEISAAFRTRPREYWISALNANGIPAGPLLERDEWLDHPQVVLNGLRVDVEDPQRGRVTMPGIPIVLTATPGRVRGPAPRPGQDNGMEPWDPQIEPMGTAPVTAGPLVGVKVLDLGTFVATPYAGFLLSELGADVTKVEPLTGDPYRGSGFGVNRGMKSVAMDLSSEQGAALFHRLVGDVDAVVDGMRPGVMSKLRIDYESLRQTKDDIVSISLAAFGMEGPLAGLGGVDMVVQAMCGMMLAQGEPDSPVSNTIAILDTTAAALSACATVLALFHKQRTGQGQRVWNSLVGTASFSGDGELVRYEGRTPAQRGGIDHKGGGVLDRYYEVLDGWVRVQTADTELTASDLVAAGIPVDRLTTEAVSRALLAFTADEAVTALTNGGIPATAARKVSELFRDVALRDEEFSHFRTSDIGTTIATPGRYATFSRTQRQGPLTPAGIGENSVDALAAAGLTAAEIDAAVDSGAVVTGGRSPIRLGAIYR